MHDALLVPRSECFCAGIVLSALEGIARVIATLEEAIVSPRLLLVVICAIPATLRGISRITADCPALANDRPRT